MPLSGRGEQGIADHISAVEGLVVTGRYERNPISCDLSPGLQGSNWRETPANAVWQTPKSPERAQLSRHLGRYSAAGFVVEDSRDFVQEGSTAYFKYLWQLGIVRHRQMEATKQLVLGLT